MAQRSSIKKGEDESRVRAALAARWRLCTMTSTQRVAAHAGIPAYRARKALNHLEEQSLVKRRVMRTKIPTRELSAHHYHGHRDKTYTMTTYWYATKKWQPLALEVSILALAQRVHVRQDDELRLEENEGVYMKPLSEDEPCKVFGCGEPAYEASYCQGHQYIRGHPR